MIRYPDLPGMLPPVEDTVKAIEGLRAWLDDPLNVEEPEEETTDSVMTIADNAEDIESEITEAYTKDSTEADEDATAEKYHKRLRQISDVATLVASAELANISRKELLVEVDDD